MSKELQDFEYFKLNQLHYFDPTTGRIDVKGRTKTAGNYRYHSDVGSLNPDGYVRLWCNGSLRMKHRLVYFLYHGEIPSEGEEIDHYNDDRSDNRISNLRILTKGANNSLSTKRKYGKQLTKAQVVTICELLESSCRSDMSIAKEVGRSRATVRDIKIRRSRTSISQDYSWPHRMQEASETIEKQGVSLN